MTMRFIHKAILGGALLSGVGGVALWAQTQMPPPMPVTPSAAQPSAVQRNYLNKHVIQLPILIEESQRQLIKEIQLFVKDQPTSPWTLRDTVGPTQQVFTFQAPKDGEYWFAMVTVDNKGRSHPADLRNEPPGLVVIIDTQPPVIEMINLGETPIGTLVQCDIREANPDSTKSRLTYQGGDNVFREMLPVPGRANVFCIPAEMVCTGIVRAHIEDLAGNTGFREEHLTKMKTSKTAPAVATAPVQEKNVPGPLPKLGTGPTLLPVDQPKVPNPAPVERVNHRPDGSQGPRWLADGVKEAALPVLPAMTPTPTHNVAKPPVVHELKRQFVNNAKIYLDYQVENAGQTGAKVEAWITRDQGKTWQKAGDNSLNKSPIEVVLPGDGLFGVSLIAANARGVVQPPAAGETPDGWIEVDTTKPDAKITSVRCSTENGHAIVHVSWSVQDRNLADGPVDLFYAATAQGPWLPLAKGLKADGEHRWAPPAEIGSQAHLRVTARDQAGNVGIASTLEAVQFGPPATPRAVIRNISTNGPAPTNTLPVRVTPGPLQIVQPPPGN